MSAGTQLEQETIRRQAEILQVIFESLPMGVMVADLEGRLLSNPAARRILDPGTCVPITPEQTTVFGWYLSDQVTVVPTERFPLLSASHGEEFTDELFFVRRLDHPEGLWISMSGGPLRDAPEPISGGVVFFQDVTERHQEIQSVTLLSRVLEQTADSVMLTDKPGKIEIREPRIRADQRLRSRRSAGRNSPYS